MSTHWTSRVARSALIVAVPAVFVCGAPLAASADTAAAGGPLVDIIVRELDGSGDAPEQLVERLGGDVGLRIDLIDGFAASVPAAAVDVLRHAPGVHSIATNSPIKLLAYDGFDPVAQSGSTAAVADVVGADDFWARGITGQGVDVALIDSGVAPVNGLTFPGKVLHGPDLSPESQSPELDHLDTYGHGTHLAGLIAGRDNGLTTVSRTNPDHFVGMAPGARVVSIKVADAAGSTDITQVLAAIDWVVQHRNAHGMNIRVLNLSFGTDSTQDHRLDPLTYAVEQAWHKGIVVVVAGGNDGVASRSLTNPAYDPYVIAVGGADGRGTRTVADDVVGDFSSRGSTTRRPDLVAPGKSLVSLRSPGSFTDVMHPEGRVGTRLMRGTGTSQAAAVVSGAAALLLQQRPGLTPDQVKAILTGTAKPLPDAHATAQGAGQLDMTAALTAGTPNPNAVAQKWARATGTGLVELTRGSYHMYDGTAGLFGERDVFGKPFVSSTWAALSAREQAWSGGTWNGTAWTGPGFSADLCVPAAFLEVIEPVSGIVATTQLLADTGLLEPIVSPVLEDGAPCVPVSSVWTSTTWSANRWAAIRWTANRWTGNTWTGNTWTGNTWTGNTWTGNTWTGNTWTGNTWTGNTWTGNTWSGNTWTTASWDDHITPAAVLDAHQGKRLKDDSEAQRAQKDKKDRIFKGAVPFQARSGDGSPS